MPGRVYALSGFEFTEYYFVVSDDGRELIGIDAGTRPDSAKSAYEALRTAYPALPPLTTVLITHAHWDHVGGHRYFRELDSKPRFIARSNYAEEIEAGLKAPQRDLKHFFGQRFALEELRTFKPDATVDRQTELKLGGTRIELIPVQGGETHDALFIHFPDLGVLFVGDFIMPYLGAPFTEEGDLDGLLKAIDVVVEKNPRRLLHGHEPLTTIFNSPAMLAAMQGHLAWLREQVLAGIRDGAERGALQQANLIPPELLRSDPATHVAYLVMRENVINRLYDQNVGYWQPDMQGVDYLTRADRGSLLVDYLGVSERRLADAAQRMIDDGRYELAANLLDATRGRFPESAALARAERLAYLKLKEKYQDTNPFKFILYSGRIGDATPQVAQGRAAPMSAAHNNRADLLQGSCCQDPARPFMAGAGRSGPANAGGCGRNVLRELSRHRCRCGRGSRVPGLHADDHDVQRRHRGRCVFRGGACNRREDESTMPMHWPCTFWSSASLSARVSASPSGREGGRYSSSWAGGTMRLATRLCTPTSFSPRPYRAGLRTCLRPPCAAQGTSASRPSSRRPVQR